ncbi:hypothetical protein CROQUDRAFT_102713 [Cronartium quercuum f. sp. fusiforme G11]|uniref:Uncharacterized protein n=1 Tax=Cronartium quercuum f. sp. fusiforme G11 TaxID=708437 RepID=A0A9P6N4N7_9BASI|nr:hypothetical protein CROQUDRAFT_102713 [Cronartium quercuum f. sp. fusiforme G11]
MAQSTENCPTKVVALASHQIHAGQIGVMKCIQASVLKPWPLGAPRAAPEGLHLKEADSLGFWS